MSEVQIRPLLLDRERAAEVLGISERTLEGLVAAGEIPPPRKISKQRVGWLWRELEEFAESRPVSDHLPPRSPAAAKAG